MNVFHPVLLPVHGGGWSVMIKSDDGDFIIVYSWSVNLGDDEMFMEGHPSGELYMRPVSDTPAGMIWEELLKVRSNEQTIPHVVARLPSLGYDARVGRAKKSQFEHHYSYLNME